MVQGTIPYIKVRWNRIYLFVKFGIVWMILKVFKVEIFYDSTIDHMYKWRLAYIPAYLCKILQCEIIPTIIYKDVTRVLLYVYNLISAALSIIRKEHLP